MANNKEITKRKSKLTAMKPNKQKIIDSIVLEIESGKSYSETLAVNGDKWQLSERTFDRYWKKANEAYSVILADRKKIFDFQTTQNYIDAVERGLMTKYEKLRLLEDIMTGKKEFEKVFIVHGKKETIMVKADASDVMRAIEIHNRMTGDNEAEKVKTDLADCFWNMRPKKYAGTT